MNRSFRTVLLPTVGQALGCLLASFLTLVVLYRDQLWHRLQQGVQTTSLGQLNYGGSLSNVLNSSLIHTAVIVGFWSAVGLVAYTVVWSFVNVMIEARNEVILETEYTNKSALMERIKVPLTQIGLATLLFVGIYGSAKLLMPVWFSMVETSLSNPVMWQSALVFIGAVFGGAFNLYVLLLLGQLVFWVG